MKWMLMALIWAAGLNSVHAQKSGVSEVVVPGNSINLASEKVNNIFVAPPEQFMRLKSARVAKSEFDVHYVNFSEKAKQAFEYAVSIWESLLTSPVPVKVQARWESLEGNVLAAGRPATFHMNFEGAPLANVYYPVALAERLTGENLNPNDVDIVCVFNSNYPWYFGVDGNTPSSGYDFVSAVLHEIAHGLGFSGFFKDNGETGFLNNGNNLPSIYDFFVFNNWNQQLTDESVFFRPSIELHKQLTSEKLKFYKFDEIKGNEHYQSSVYAPPEWKDGVSIYHLNSENNLMNAVTGKGQAIHSPGEIVLGVLSGIGWEAVSFDFKELKDFEEPCAELPVDIGVVSDFNLAGATMKFIFSTDNFSSSESVNLRFNESVNRFSGKIPLNYYSGGLQYYFELYTDNDKLFKLPALAPSKVFSLNIGPDYFPPVMAHNPVKIVAVPSEGLNFNAVASDNVGINSVQIEYKLNGVLKDPVSLKNMGDDKYEGELGLPEEILKSSKLEYRIVAEDKSVSGNKKILPSAGYYQVSVFQALDPVSSYSTNFENGTVDFVNADFYISRVAGFTGNILHTRHPYAFSAIENEKYNLIAQLRYPVILQDGGKMTFQEIVLVEPGESNTSFYDEMFWDYVVVEASKNYGKTWVPLASGYDSGADDDWYSLFTGSLTNNTSTAIGQENMFVRNTINLTDGTGFKAGDTVLIRFRLASDMSVNGWGWAIDNLEIQKSVSTQAEILTERPFNVYPNPFSNRFFIDWGNTEQNGQLNITVTDLYGKTVYRRENADTFSGAKTWIEMPDASPGMYMLKVSDRNSTIFTQKIIKN